MTIPKDLVERAQRVGATDNVEDAIRDLSRWPELYEWIISDLTQAIEHHEKWEGGVAEEKLLQWYLTYICANCGGFAEVPLLAIEVLDSGTTLTCDKCGEATVVDLFTPEERAKLYRQARLYEEPPQPPAFLGHVDGG